MCRFIESICCLEGKAQLIDLHQERVNRTFLEFFPQYIPIKLSDIVQNIPAKGKYKCRVEYSFGLHSIEFKFYQTPSIHSLQVVQSDSIEYEYKSTKREELDRIFEQRGLADDIIIVKNGRVTDSYFANLVFFDGKKWWTPDRPLLQGIKRQSLINLGLLKTKKIFKKDLSTFQKVSLINAMLDLGEVEVLLK